MSDLQDQPDTGDATTPSGRGLISLNPTVVRRVTLGLVALLGLAAALLVLARTDDDPLATLLGAWPTVLGAGALYALGMATYSASWAALFGPDESRGLLALSFIISQPVKYLPGGVAQPLGQIALGAQVATSSRQVVVAFPVHVLLNVVAAATLSSPFLLIADVPPWSRWLILLVPILWVSLDRRWMAGLLGQLSRLIRYFRVSSDLPRQRQINKAFLIALGAHSMMFSAFGVLTATSVPGWTAAELSIAYGVAWLVGYIALPAPAGLGAREAVLAVLLAASISTTNIVKISAVHRVATLIVELALLFAAIVVATRMLRKRVDHDRS